MKLSPLNKQAATEDSLRPLDHPDLNRDKVVIHFLLDSSGSMGEPNKFHSTIEGYNAYIDELRSRMSGRDVSFSMSMFDSFRQRRVVDCRLPLHRVTKLTTANYVCSGGTPLVDSCMGTIADAKAEVEGMGGNPKVIVVFQTDGEHNVDGRYTNQDLLAEITLLKARGWQFAFLGCEIDAYAVADRYNIDAASTVSYSAASTGPLLRATAQNAANYAAGTTASIGYTADQKKAAGDKGVK